MRAVTVCTGRFTTAILLVAFWAHIRPPAALATQLPEPWTPSDRFGETAYIGLNGLLGAITAGIEAYLTDRPLADALLGGAAGGVLGYAGKRVAVEDFRGSGMLGRQLSAVGASLVRNAGTEDRLLASLMFPLGPLRIHVDPYERRIEHVRLQLHEAGALIYALTRDELELDWGESLSSGAPVFIVQNGTILHDGQEANGVTVAGVVIVEGTHRVSRDRVLRHERVHVIQHDFAAHAIAGPVDDWFFRRVPALSPLGAYLEPAFATLLVGLSPFADAREAEASFLDQR